jgi:hypothetical protein
MLALIAVLLAQGASVEGIRVQDEGVTKGYVSTLNYTGAGISCSVAGPKATCNVPGGAGGGGGTPGGLTGNVQVNNAGAFGAYTGTSCAYAIASLDASGVASCRAAPTIPTPAGSGFELQTRASGTSFGTYSGTSCGYAIKTLGADGVATCSAAPTPYTLPAPTATTLGGVKSLTCAGTDKVSAIGTDGLPVCSADQTGAGGGGAPTAATYIVQTADAALTGEQVLASLGTGLVKNTTGTGVLSIAASGTDYAPATSGSAILKGNGAGGFSNAVSGTDYQAPLTLPLSIANGGTGASLSAVNGGIVYSTSTAHAHSAAGIAGQSLFSTGAGAPGWADAQKLVRLTADYTNATTTMSNTALSWTSPAAVSRSAFICQLMVKSSVTTIGAQVDVTASVAPTAITYELFYITAAGTPPSTAGTHSVIAATANSTALGTTTGLTTYTIWRLEGIIVHTASASTVTIRAKASAAGTITIGSGSNCQYSVL